MSFLAAFFDPILVRTLFGFVVKLVVTAMESAGIGKQNG